jgi:hypothetical protein
MAVAARNAASIAPAGNSEIFHSLLPAFVTLLSLTYLKKRTKNARAKGKTRNILFILGYRWLLLPRGVIAITISTIDASSFSLRVHFPENST